MSFLPIIFANSFDPAQAQSTTMAVVVSHIEWRLLARAVVPVNCALFIKETSLIEEYFLLKEVKSLLSEQSLMFGKTWFPH